MYVRIALLQFAPEQEALQENLEEILTGMDRAAAAGAHLLVAPEMSLTGWSLPNASVRARLAERVSSEAIPALADASDRSDVAVVVGGPYPGAGDAQSNCAIAIAPGGRQVQYRKVHLFGAERDWWTPGDRGDAILELGPVRVGVSICYDAEFPEMPRLARLAGAELLVVVATNMSPYERDQDLIFPTRALENELPVVVCNRVGSERGWTYFGRSLAANARGGIVAQAGRDKQLLVADIEPAGGAGDPDLSYVARRRPDVYGPLSQRTVAEGVEATSGGEPVQKALRRWDAATDSTTAPTDGGHLKMAAAAFGRGRRPREVGRG
jgi:predicted amidohydrolase